MHDRKPKVSSWCNSLPASVTTTLGLNHLYVSCDVCSCSDTAHALLMLEHDTVSYVTCGTAQLVSALQISGLQRDLTATF